MNATVSLPFTLKVPYVPSTPSSVTTMLKLADVQPAQKMADLGSGDGRIIVAFAQAGAEAHGYEVNPGLILKAEDNILKAKLDHQAFIHPQSYWEANLTEYDIITIYGMASIMEQLGQKLQAELQPGAKIISNVFTFPGWQPEQVQNNVYLYLRKNVG